MQRFHSAYLKALGVLNPHPERVRASWFSADQFFDARDLVQVKYEMLRHASREGATKADSALLFGLSRPTFYQAEATFARNGLTGLLPRHRGPKGAHKLKPEVMAFIEQQLAGDGRTREGAGAPHRNEAGRVGPSTQHRARHRAQKKTLNSAPPHHLPLTAIETYEALRAEVLQGRTRPEGFRVVVHHGMLTGLTLALASTPASLAVAPMENVAVPAMPHDRQFVRLLANMLLRSQSEGLHVY